MQNHYDTYSIATVLGCLLNNTTLLTDSDLKVDDFVSRPHKILFSAISNLSILSDKTSLNTLDVDAYLSSTPLQHQIFKDNKIAEYIDYVKNKADIGNFKFCVNNIKKLSLIRDLTANGFDVSEIYCQSPLSADYDRKMQAFNKMSVSDIVNYYNMKILDLKIKWSATDDGAREINKEKAVDDFLASLGATPNYGTNLKSGLLTAITRGNRKKNIYLFSGDSGVGKSRSLISEALNQACDEIFDIDKNKWVSNGIEEPTLYITTELEADEVLSISLAYLSGIDESRIHENNLNEEEYTRLRKAAELFNKCPLHIEYIADFDVSDIVNLIEKHVLINKITHVFHDYIQMTGKSYEYARKHYGVSREDLILVYMVAEIKERINKLDVFFESSTQLNRSIKQESEKSEIDAGVIRGSYALSDKISLGAVRVLVDSKKLEAVAPIMRQGLYKTPNTCTYIYKNRGAKLKRVIVWTHFDLGTMREVDCFVTNYEFEPVEVNPLHIEIQAYEEEIVDETPEDILKNIADFQAQNPEVADIFEGLDDLRTTPKLGFGTSNIIDTSSFEEEYESEFTGGF